jgi:hypothetical protein
MREDVMKRGILFLVLSALSLSLCAQSLAAKADLAISPSDLAVTPAQPTSQDTLVVTVTVHNVGSAASPSGQILCKALRGNKKGYKQTASLPSIPAGGEVQVAFTIGPLAEGTYTLVAKADPQNGIKESSESNNKAMATLAVVAPSSSAGEAAAAVYLESQDIAQAMLDLGDLALAGLRGRAEKSGPPGDFTVLAQLTGALATAFGRPEATFDCSKGGAMEYTVITGSTVRPTSMSLTSPAAGAADCTSWIYRDPEDPSVGLFEVLHGSLSLEMHYLSDSPADPGYLRVSSITLAAGDGSPSTPESFELSTWESYKDGTGALQERLLMTEACDFVMTLSVVGWDALGLPNHVLYAATGTISHADALNAVTLVASCSGFTVEASYSGTTSDLAINVVLGGTLAVANSAAAAGNFSVAFSDLGMTMQVTPTLVGVFVAGGFDLASTCATGSFALSTPEPVTFIPGAACPRSGKIAVSSTLGNPTVTFNADGSVGVDETSDGTVDRTYAYCEELVLGFCAW